MTRLRPPFLWIAAPLALFPLPAAAQTVGPNSVSCVYDTLTIEDREIAMVLSFVRYGYSGSERANWRRGVAVVVRMIEEARERCQQAYSWSQTQAHHAREYAFHSLLIEAMRQRIEAETDLAAEPIDRWFARKHSILKAKLDPDSDEGLAFAAYLVEQGWSSDNAEQLKLARSYLDALRQRAESATLFADARASS